MPQPLGDPVLIQLDNYLETAAEGGRYYAEASPTGNNGAQVRGSAGPPCARPHASGEGAARNPRPPRLLRVSQVDREMEREKENAAAAEAAAMNLVRD